MDDIEKLAEVFKALSDPTRLRLIRLLNAQPSGGCLGECNDGQHLCVNALAHKLGVTQSAVSQHLRVLRQVGLVHGVRHGRFVHYSIDREGLARHRSVLVETLGQDFATE